MQALSKKITIILITLLVQIICNFAFADSGILSSNGNLSSAVQGSQVVSDEVIQSKQLQYYKSQFSKSTPMTTQTSVKSNQLMGGYPSNFSGSNSSSVFGGGGGVGSVNSNGSSNSSNGNIGVVYVAAGQASRNMLPTNPVIGGSTTSPSVEPSRVDVGMSNVVNGLSVVPPVVPPKSEFIPVSGESSVGVGSNLNSVPAKVQTPNQSSVSNLVPTSNSNSNSASSSLGSVDLNLSDKGSSESSMSKGDSRLKPTESMQDVMLNPKKLRSLIPSFLLRPKVDDPFSKDDGLEEVDKIRQGKEMTEQEYIESATRSRSVVSRDIFIRARGEELSGNYSVAADLYKEFIRLNSKRTSDGTLAVPYHRLAVISWGLASRMGGLSGSGRASGSSGVSGASRTNGSGGSSESSEADVYFRYALKYAKDGVVQFVVSDYNNFLTECGRLDQAESILRNAISLFPYELRLRVELGRCLARQDRAVEALRHIRPVLGESQAYVELAIIYRGMGDYAMSDVLMQRRNEYIARSGERGFNEREGIEREFVVAKRDVPISKVGREVSGVSGVGGVRSNVGGRVRDSRDNVVESGNNGGIRVGGVSVDANNFVNNFPNRVSNNFVSDVSNGDSNFGVGVDTNFPIDPFNVFPIVDSVESYGLGEAGLRGVDNLSGSPLFPNLPLPNQELSNQPLSNQPLSNQPLLNQPSDLMVSPSYRLKGYHYSVDDVPPTFLQY